MSDSEETIKQEPTLAEVLAVINKRFEAVDAQLEAIREGISYNSSRLDRLEGNMLLMRADVRDIGEELKKDKLALK